MIDYTRASLRPAVLATLTALAVCTAPASAADYFLKLDDIKGSSVAENHRDWNAIESFSWGLEIPPSSSGTKGGTSERLPEFKDFEWTQALDASIARLFERASQGDPLRKVTLHATTTLKETQVTFFEMVFEGAYITQLDLSGSSDELPSVSAAFDYQKITLKYIALRSDGSKGTEYTGSYDLTNNAGSAAALVGVYAMAAAGPTVLAVPEPEGWALLLAGLGLTALVARRRTRTTRD